MSDDFDFGFSAVSTEEFQKPRQQQKFNHHQFLLMNLMNSKKNGLYLKFDSSTWR